MIRVRIRESPIQEQAILGHRCKKGFTKKITGLSANSRVPSRLTESSIAGHLSHVVSIQTYLKKSCKRE